MYHISNPFQNDYLYNNYQTTPENVEYYELTPVAPEKMNKVSNFAIKFKTSGKFHSLY